MRFEPVPLPYAGGVDADGHVMEPSWLWTEYGEERYQERMLRLEVNDDGLEVVYIDGVPSDAVGPGMISTIGTMGAVIEASPDRRYNETLAFGGANPDERLQLLDMENLDRVVLYPTLGLLWEAAITDVELTYACARAYNRWIADYCRGSGDRLVAIAHIPLIDPAQAALELERAVNDGCRGAFIPTFTHTRKAPGHPDHDPVWSVAQDLGVPVGVHPAREPRWAEPLDRFEGMINNYLVRNVLNRDKMAFALVSFFSYGTVERFPTLKLGFLESGAGWIGSLLERMDSLSLHKAGLATAMEGPALSELPSTYFKRQCFISCDPDETSVSLIIEHVGAQCFIWASDYPHGDHPATYVTDVVNLVVPLSESARAAVLGQNIVDLYQLAEVVR